MTLPVVIVGAGCAGLSLAVALVDAGYEDPVVVLDPRRRFPRDRTWCFWDTGDIPWTRLATARWPRWTIGDAEQTASRHPYLQLPSDRFAEAALRRLGRARRVDVRLGWRASALRPDRVRTADGVLRARHVIDARGPAHPAVRAAIRSGPAQRFRGQLVRTARPRFDPGCATLMDFAPQQDDEVRFMYVLPLGEREALVEDTSFSDAALPADARRAAIAAWLATPHTVLWEEHGTIPMHPIAPRHADVAAVGLAGGAARPSSGYAFVRIQQQARQVAEALCRGRDPAAAARLAAPRRDALDALFLRAMRSAPATITAGLTALAQGTSGDVLARFMNDASAPADDTQVAAAVASMPFLRAVARG